MAKKDSVEFSAETREEAEKMAREYFEFYPRYETIYIVAYEGGFHCFDDLKVAEKFGKPEVFHR